MEQDISPLAERIELSLNCSSETSSRFSELRIIASIVWTANPPIDYLAGAFLVLTHVECLYNLQNVSDIIFQMLSNISDSARINLVPYCEYISNSTWQFIRRSTGGQVKMVAKIKIYMNAHPRRARDSPLRRIQFPPRLSQESEEVDRALAVSFTESGFRGMPATSSAISKLEKVIYGSTGEGCRETECIICLEDFETGVELSKMPCSHAFHQICLSKWLEQSHQCPLCRFALPAQMEE